jgi:hypothetical protein
VLLDIIPVEASGAEVLVGEVFHTLEESPAGAGVSKGPVLKQKHSSKGLKSIDLAWKPLFSGQTKPLFFLQRWNHRRLLNKIETSSKLFSNTAGCQTQQDVIYMYSASSRYL